MNYSYIEYINFTVSTQMKGFGVFQEPLIKLTFGWSSFKLVDQLISHPQRRRHKSIGPLVAVTDVTTRGRHGWWRIP